MEGGIPKGTEIGSYVIDSFIGRGGMGVVYRAYHPRLDRWSAIKLLPPFASSADARDRFEREARAVARLRHRHILSVFEFGDYQGQPYMVVEFMPNGSLSERMPAAALAVPAALAILRPLGEALDHAHSQGVLHRDVKPGNVFLDADFQPVLADFGLAKLAGEQSLTASGMVAGTPTHISPEQAQGRPLDNRADLYSLAVIGYQLLTGGLPFTGDGMMDMLYAHVHRVPPPPSSINPALSGAVDEVIARALAKDPSERFGSAAELMGALEAADAGRADERRPRSPEAVIPIVTAALPAAAGSPPASAAPAPSSGRLRWVYLAALSLLVLFAAGAAYQYLPRFLGAAGSAAVPVEATPSAAALRRLVVDPPSPLRIGDTITVSGDGLDPVKKANAGVLQRGVVHPISGGFQALADGSFRVDGVVPSDLATGAAAVVACNLDAQGRSDLSQCIQLNVTVVR